MNNCPTGDQCEMLRDISAKPGAGSYGGKSPGMGAERVGWRMNSPPHPSPQLCDSQQTPCLSLNCITRKASQPLGLTRIPHRSPIYELRLWYKLYLPASYTMGQQPFSHEEPVVNVFNFVEQTISVTTAPLSPVNESSHKQYVNRWERCSK